MISRRTFLSTACVASLLGCRATPRSRNVVPRPVAQEQYVSIGGIDQWISMRGASANNLALLFLHGGPGEAQSYFWDLFDPWLADFTVVHWDQRGAGKTFARRGELTPGMNLTQIAADTCEVADYVRHNLAKERVLLVGHSWGSMVALVAAKQRPDLFHAVVGTGQVVNWALSLQAQERYAREQATASGDRAALSELDHVASLSLADDRRINAVGRFLMNQSDLDYLAIQRRFVGAPPFPESGAIGEFVGGARFSARHLVPETHVFDARRIAADLTIPIFVIDGRDDHVTPFEVAAAYVRDLSAPKKAFVLIEGGHFACFMSGREFVRKLRGQIEPLTRVRG